MKLFINSLLFLFVPTHLVQHTLGICVINQYTCIIYSMKEFINSTVLPVKQAKTYKTLYWQFCVWILKECLHTLHYFLRISLLLLSPQKYTLLFDQNVNVTLACASYPFSLFARQMKSELINLILGCYDNFIKINMTLFLLWSFSKQKSCQTYLLM